MFNTLIKCYNIVLEFKNKMLNDVTTQLNMDTEINKGGKNMMSMMIKITSYQIFLTHI